MDVLRKMLTIQSKMTGQLAESTNPHEFPFKKTTEISQSRNLIGATLMESGVEVRVGIVIGGGVGGSTIPDTNRAWSVGAC